MPSSPKQSDVSSLTENQSIRDGDETRQEKYLLSSDLSTPITNDQIASTLPNVLCTPFTLRSIPLEIISIGTIMSCSHPCATVEKFWRKFKGEYQHPYPIGFKAILRLKRKKHIKTLEGNKSFTLDPIAELIQFQMEVVKGEVGPEFVVTDISSSSRVGSKFSGTSCSQPFKDAFKIYQPVKNGDVDIVEYTYMGISDINDLTGLKAFGFCDIFFQKALNTIARNNDSNLPTKIKFFAGISKARWKSILEREREKLLKEIHQIESKIESAKSTVTKSTRTRTIKRKRKKIVKNYEEDEDENSEVSCTDDSERGGVADSESSQISPKPSERHGVIVPLKKLKMDHSLEDIPSLTPIRAQPSPTMSDTDTVRSMAHDDLELLMPRPITVKASQDSSVAEDSEIEDTTLTRASLVNMAQSPIVDKITVSPCKKKEAPSPAKTTIPIIDSTSIDVTKEPTSPKTTEGQPSNPTTPPNPSTTAKEVINDHIVPEMIPENTEEKNDEITANEKEDQIMKDTPLVVVSTLNDNCRVDPSPFTVQESIVENKEVQAESKQVDKIIAQEDKDEDLLDSPIGSPLTVPKTTTTALFAPTMDINFSDDFDATPPLTSQEKPNEPIQKDLQIPEMLDDDDTPTPQDLSPIQKMFETTHANEATKGDNNYMMEEEEIPGTPTPTDIKPIIEQTIVFDPNMNESSDDDQGPASTPPNNTSRILSYTTPKSDHVENDDTDDDLDIDDKIELSPCKLSPSKRNNPFMQVNYDSEEESPRTPSPKPLGVDLMTSPILNPGGVTSPVMFHSNNKKSTVEIEPTVAIDFDNSLLMDESDEEMEGSSPTLGPPSTSPKPSPLPPPPVCTPPTNERAPSTPVLSTPPRSQPLLSQNSLPLHPIEKINRQHPLKPYNRIRVSSPVINMLFSPSGEPKIAICTKNEVSVRELTGSEWIQTEQYDLYEEKEEFYYVKFSPDSEILIIAGSSFEPSITMTMSLLDDGEGDQLNNQEGITTYHVKFYEIDGQSISNKLSKKPVLSLDDVRAPIKTMEIFENILIVTSTNGDILKYTLSSDFRNRSKVTTMDPLPGKETINSIEFVSEVKNLVIGTSASYLGIWKVNEGKLVQTLPLTPYAMIKSTVLRAVTSGNNQGIFVLGIHIETSQKERQSCAMFFFNEHMSRMHCYDTNPTIPKAITDAGAVSATCMDVTRSASSTPYLVMGTSNGKLLIFNYRTPQCVGLLGDVDGENIGACCFHSRYPLLAVGASKHVVVYYQDK